MNKINTFLLSTITASLLVGCGGGSSDSTSSSNSSTSNTAYLVDSPIEGMEYSCDSSSEIKVTGADGAFNYDSTCNVITFSIGNIAISSLDTKNINTDGKIYPADLLSLERTDTTTPRLQNMLRFLQSIDSDNNPNNGITIDEATKATLKNANAIDFSKLGDADTTIVENLFTDTLTDKTLISVNDAVAHYEDTLRNDLKIDVETVAPAKAIAIQPLVLRTNKDKESITINGERDAKVFIDGIDSGIVIDKNNTATVDLDTTGADGIKSFNITLKDLVDNESVPLSLSINKDTIAPIKAINSSIPSFINSASVNKDSLTTTITGEDGSSVFVNGTEVGTIANGSYELTLDTSGPDGAKSFSITLKDLVGNESDPLSLSINKDTIAPIKAINSSIPSFINSASVNKDSLTTTITGEDGSSVFVNGTEVGTIANGSYELTLDTSGVDGAKSFSITLKDLVGNESAPLSLSINKDTIAPSKSTSSNIPSYINNSGKSITLTGEDGSLVFVDGSEVGTITNGTYELALNPAGADGLKSFNVTLKDLAGNESEAFVFNITKDTIAPLKATIKSTAEIINDTIKVEVKGEIGSSVYINDTYITMIPDSGIAIITLDNPKNSYYELFKIKLVDSAENISEVYDFVTTFSRINLNSDFTYFVPEDMTVVKNSVTNEEAIIMSYESNEVVGGAIAKIALNQGESISARLATIISQIRLISGLNTPVKLTEQQISNILKEGIIAEYTLTTSSNFGSIEIISKLTNQIMGGNLTNLPTASGSALLSNYFNILFNIEKDTNGNTYITISVVPNSEYSKYQTITNSIINTQNIKANNEVLVNNSDEFTVNTSTQKKTADFLFVVDDSGSMSSYQNAVSQAATDFATAITNAGIDYRISIITTSDSISDLTTTSCSYFNNCPASRILNSIGIIKNDIDKFKTNLIVGTDGSGTETGIYNAEYALKSTVLGDSTDGILTTLGMPANDTTPLSVIILSDEKSQYTSRAGYGNNFDPSNNLFIDRGYTVYSIINTYINSSSQYDDLAISTNGLIADISNTSNYSTIMNTIAQKASGNLGYKLTNENVIESTIYVKVNDVEVAHDNTNGWKYIPAYNSVLFYGTAVPKDGDKISVSYSNTEK
jgi:hypothetical protein